MATSRTGTAKYKAWRKRVLRAGQRAGITHCPCTFGCTHHRGRPCAVPLDYERGLRPNSAEPDHVVPHKHGGRETSDNGSVLCRRCNQSIGDRPKTPGARTRTQTAVQTVELDHSDW